MSFGFFFKYDSDPKNSKDLSVDEQKSLTRLYEIHTAKQTLGGQLKTMFAVGGWENSQYFSSVINILFTGKNTTLFYWKINILFTGKNTTFS